MTLYLLLIDNQDGGYTVRAFASEKEREDYQRELAQDMDVHFDVNDEYELGYRATVGQASDGTFVAGFGQ